MLGGSVRGSVLGAGEVCEGRWRGSVQVCAGICAGLRRALAGNLCRDPCGDPRTALVRGVHLARL